MTDIETLRELEIENRRLREAVLQVAKEILELFQARQTRLYSCKKRC
jgi:hypothetical protein